MSFYELAVFTHVLGVLGLFAGLGLYLASALRLRRAQAVAQARAVIGLGGIQARLIQVAALLLLASGIYMVVTAWEWDTPWILVSLAAFVGIGALGGGVVDRRFTAIKLAAGEVSGGPIPPALRARIADPVLWTALQTMAMLALGVVFLMTNKPDLLVSLLTVAVALVLGVVVAQPWRRPREGGASVKEASKIREGT